MCDGLCVCLFVIKLYSVKSVLLVCKVKTKTGVVFSFEMYFFISQHLVDRNFIYFSIRKIQGASKIVGCGYNCYLRVSV